MPQFRRNRRSLGFTLLEICIAVAIMGTLLAMALPSLSGVLAERRLQTSLSAINDLVANARLRSITDHEPYLIAWDAQGRVHLCPEEEAADAKQLEAAPIVKMPPGNCALTLTAALLKAPRPEWTFWPTGNCEPATLRYAGPAGSWVVSYDPLTARPRVLNFQPR